MISAATVPPPPPTSSAGPANGKVVVATPSSGTGGASNANKGGGNNNKGMRGNNKKLQPQRRHSPPTLAPDVIDRAHSVDGSCAGPVPLRRASYAFDHSGGGHRHNNPHQKSSTPPYHPHHHHLHHQQNHAGMNGALIHQHSAPPLNASTHHQDSSDCGSSSGLGGMGTPIKGGESGCSISSSSNNSVIADCSHDSRDSGGPISSPGTNQPPNAESANGIGGGQQNGHRSLVATATLTQSMVSSQPMTTTISPVSSIPTLVQQQPQPIPNPAQIFSCPPPGIHPNAANSPSNPPPIAVVPSAPHHQFGAFISAAASPSNGQQQPPQSSSSPSIQNGPQHLHSQQPQHFQPNGMPHQHPNLLHQQQHFHHPAAAAAVAQFNALQAAVAAAAMLPPAANPPNGHQSGAAAGNSPIPLGAALYDGSRMPPPAHPQRPPQQSGNPQPHWNASPPQQNIGGQKQQQQLLMPNEIGNQQQQQQQMGMGRALYTMTCETAALASVGAAAVTAGYHVTLEPCASAPPIIPPSGPAPPQQTPTGEDDSQSPPSQQPQCTPPPGFQQQQSAANAGANGTENAGSEENDGSTGGNQQQQSGDQPSTGSGEGGMPVPMNGPTSNGGGQPQSQQCSNGPLHPPGSTNAIMPPGVPPEIAAAISGGHDLFVHIHPGDAIALAVGNEIQHIHGPATIRMVSQSVPPSAIPMNVPQGHIVQQLLDRQGYLSHIIMSQEMPPMAAPTPPGPSMGQAQIGGQQTGPGQQRHPHQLHPHHHQPPPIHQSSPSPQKSNTPAGRYRPSPSSSASPPNQPHHAQHQQFVLPPGYEQQSHQPSQQHHPNQQFLTGEGPNAGFTPSTNPLNKWSPSPRGGGNHQNYYGGRRGIGAGGQMAGPSNALGTFYIEPVSQQLIAASQSPSGAFIHQQHGQQILIATEQPPPDYSSQQIPPPLGHQQAQHFAGTQMGGTGPMIPLGPFVPGGTGHHHPVGTHPVEVVPMSIEEDEKERLRDALSALPSPMVTRVGDRDADVVWQELDTSEAAASVPGFPEINQSEFTYQLILYEQNASTSVLYKTDANSGNVLHLQRLRPATDYMVCIRADLPGHGIIGHPSNYTAFRTHSSRPDPPIMPKLLSRHPTACSLQWRTPNCNGAPILAYCLQMAKGKSGPFDTLVYEGPQEQTTINGLEPSGLYRFRLFCRNEIGQSDYSPHLNVYPDRGSSNAEQRGGGGPPHSQHFQHHPAGQQQPQHLYGGPKGQQSSMASSPGSSIQQHPPPQAMIAKPPPPNVHSVMAKTIKMSWNDVQPGHEYLNVTLEVSDFAIRGIPHFAPIPMECYAASGTFATLGGLQPNRDYRFRLAVNTANGDTLHSDFVAVRTRSLGNEPQSHYKEHRYEPQQQPERNIEKAQLSAEYEQEPQPIESQQHHRGSPASGQQQQQKFGGQQKRSVAGSSTQSSQSKKGQQTQTPKGAPPQPQQIQQQSVESEEAEIVKTTAKPKEQQQLPQQPQKLQINGCSTPKFTLLTSESAKVTWRLITPGGGGSPKKGNSLDSQNGATASSSGNGQNAAMMFELQRVDRQQPQIIFSGNETEFELKGLKPVEHLQLRVRAVLLDTEGKRFEGEWSQVGSACTLSAAPTAPRNVRPLQPESPTTASGNQSGAEEEETRSKKSSASHGPTHSGHSIAICWDPPAQINGAQITEYTVHAQRFALDDLSGEKALEERLLGSSSEPQFQTPRLQAANRYLLFVCAHNEAGASPRSEPPFEYLSPPSVPDPPRDFHAEALSTSELQLSWSEPAATNGAPITSFHLNCFKLYNTRNLGEFSVSSSSAGGRHRQLVSQQIVPGSQRLVLVQSLETETDYELVLQAENAVGKSAREHLRCATLAEPPNPPEMSLAQATANTLKLKWNAAGDSASSANHYYYLERENENGTYSPVYEGDLRTAKVKGLRERSTHHFRIRAAVAKGLMLGPWSKRFSYQTTRQPPPAPKQAPIATELTADLFQLEWPANRSKEASAGADEQCEQTDEQQQFIYRLQLAPKATTSAKEKSTVEVWKTVYEGTSTQCTVPVPNASQQARQARLFIVQQFLGPDGQLVDECASAPSPITVFSSQKTPNESPKKRPLQGGKNAQSPSTSTGRGRQQQNPIHYPTPKEPTKMTVYKRLKRFGSWMKKTVSEKDCALIVLFIFVILAFGIAILLNNYYLN